MFHPVRQVAVYGAKSAIFECIFYFCNNANKSATHDIILPARRKLCTGIWRRRVSVKVKKVKVGFFYSATYTCNAATSRAVQPQEVAVDWQEPMVQGRNAAATTHTTAPINHTRPSPRKHSPDVTARARKQASDYSLLLSLSTSKG